MARLAIGVDFLAEYARLEKPVQSAVEAAISKFAEHTYAGLHLEKIQHSKDERIRTIRQDNRGAAEALNRGIAASTGELVCWLSADDQFLPGKLMAQAQAQNPARIEMGHKLFQKNCSACHGSEAKGGRGPDLTTGRWKSWPGSVGRCSSCKGNAITR